MELILPQVAAAGVYNSAVAQKGKQTSRERGVTMFEIEMPIEPGGTAYIGAQSMPITPDTLIVAKPGQVRHTKFPLKTYYIHMCVSGGALYDALTGLPNFVKTDRCDAFLALFQSLCKYYDGTREHDGIMLHSLILELIHMLICQTRKPAAPGAGGGVSAVIDETKQYIKEHPAADLSLTVLAAAAGFSPVHFHNLFKRATGSTLHEYVEEQRIKKAANLIVLTDRTLTEIAYECGFSSQSYFSFAFKRRMHCTPREYAKSIFKRYESGR